MKTTAEILKKNKCREQNALLYGAAHARLDVLFINFSMYNLSSSLHYYQSHTYELTVFFSDEEQEELIKAILSCYDLNGIKTTIVKSEVTDVYYYELTIRL